MRRIIYLSALLGACHAYVLSASAQAVTRTAPPAERVTLGIAVADAGAPPCPVPTANTPAAACLLSLSPGGAAERAGFRVGDLIRRFGPAAIATAPDLVDAVAAAKVGERVDVVLERNGELLELQVEFTPADVRDASSFASAATAVVGAVRPPVVDLCANPAAGEPGRGPWRPPYERLPVPVDGGELLALVDGIDTAVIAEGGVLSIVRRDTRDALNVTGTFQCPMSKLAGHDVWVLQLRMPSWETAFFSYAFRSASEPAFGGFRYFRGRDAPALPAEKATLVGQLVETSIASEHLSEHRAITVYLPPGARESNIPALFMADGQAVSQYARVLEPLIEAGAVQAIAIVGVHSGQGERRAREYLSGVDQEAFANHLAFFAEEVLPWASAEYGISRDRHDRALFGYSNGAAFAVTVGLERPDLFANVVPFSTGMPIENRRPAGAELPRFFFAAGDLEPFVITTRAAHELVLSVGGVSRLYIYRSGHDPLLWSVALVDVLPGIFAADQ